MNILGVFNAGVRKNDVCYELICAFYSFEVRPNIIIISDTKAYFILLNSFLDQNNCIRSYSFLLMFFITFIDLPILKHAFSSWDKRHLIMKNSLLKCC